MKDYVQSAIEEDGDLMQSGVKGMRWGVRKRDSSGASAGGKKETTSVVAKKVEAVPAKAPAKTDLGEDKQVVGAASGESSAARYDRLAGQAANGRAHEMTEQDLKFFNARTDAIAKVNKMYAPQENWLAKAAKESGKQAVQKGMTKLATKAIDKLVIDKIFPDANTKAVASQGASSVAGTLSKAVAVSKQKPNVAAVLNTPISQVPTYTPTRPSIIGFSSSKGHKAKAYSTNLPSIVTSPKPPGRHRK